MSGRAVPAVRRGPRAPVLDGDYVATDLSRWQDLIRERFVALAIQPGDRSPLRGHVRTHAVGPLAVASVASVGQTFRRTPKLIDAHGEDRLQVGLLCEGEACLEQDGRSAAVRPGSFVVYDTTRPFTWTMRAGGAWTSSPGHSTISGSTPATGRRSPRDRSPTARARWWPAPR